MAELVERNIQKAIMVGPPEEFCIPVDDLRGSSFYYLFNEDLFLEILGNRPEVAHADIDGNEIFSLRNPCLGNIHFVYKCLSFF